VKQVLANHRGIVGIATLFVILGTIYSLVTPIFEASDEIDHYPVVQYIATTGQLPVQHPGTESLWHQEGSQPPLYYLLSAGLTFWINTNDLHTVLIRNPHAKLGIPLDPENKNMLVHTPAEAFPWRGTVLAVHLIRFFGVLLGLGTVCFTYLLAREIDPANHWLPILAAAATAFNPMFIFISASVNNDNLTILLCSWTMWLCTRILKDGLTVHGSATLSITTALATISKISGLTLLPIIGLILLVYGLRPHQWRQVIYTAIAVAGAILLVASWWYVRNVILYHELLGLKTHIAVAGGRTIDLLSLIRQESYGFWVAYWALFGAVNILADPVVYGFYAVISVVGIIGLVVWLLRHLRAHATDSFLIPGILALQVLVVLVGVIRWTMQTYASQGRLLFPALGALSTLTALGLLTIVPKAVRPTTALIAGVPLLVIAAVTPFRYIAPTYASPPTVRRVPVDAVSIGARFGDLELVAGKAGSVIVEEGGKVPITLYWRANEHMDQNYSLYLHVLGRDYQQIGKIDSYPGGGLLPTTQMIPGTIYEDRYWINLDTNFETPTAIRILIGVILYGEDEYTEIKPLLSDGMQPTSISIDAGVAYPANAAKCSELVDDEDAPLASFGEFALLWAKPILHDAHPGDEIPVELVWDRLGDTLINWTVFVHLDSQNGSTLAQADEPPVDGFYPTSLWKRKCQVLDQHTLKLPQDIPPGEYSIMVGFYDATDPDFPRAVAANPNGVPYPDYAIDIGTIRVVAP